MYVRIVTFRLWGTTGDQYRQHAEEIAPAFLAWPGLHSKIWLADPEHHVYGGVYVFASRADADASRETEIFRRMQTDPTFADLTIREFDTLAAPTSVTAPELVRS
ncbi:YdhR family protein [Actinomycetospora cinnamomea]|uniref:Putative monooxygenase ydhR n=1 Tax=Actinomycetospora cinnamomea TaxID=663609 RepID=A0A2U1F2L1_9PSEU|nr:YdhR family protein [Actinomycetospora cinnamomea]PVZ06406.1 putative monooxygenase ydhR [Actinomycetospora cinnamomea]